MVSNFVITIASLFKTEKNGMHMKTPFISSSFHQKTLRRFTNYGIRASPPQTKTPNRSSIDCEQILPLPKRRRSFGLCSAAAPKSFLQRCQVKSTGRRLQFAFGLSGESDRWPGPRRPDSTRDHKG